MSKVYKFWMILISVIGGISLIYYVILMLSFGLGLNFYYFWLMLGLLCILLDVGLLLSTRKGRIPPKWMVIPVEILVLLGFLIFIIVEALIIHGANKQPQESADYLIVLGAKVNGTQPSLSLHYRIRSAVEYLKRNPDTVVIASGGKGSDEGIAEAECIRRELIEQGIDSERILLEDKSTSTLENLTFSAAIIRERTPEIPDDPSGSAEEGDSQEILDSVVITTNDFHIYRSLQLAETLGYRNVYGNPAPSVWWLIPTNYTREFFAVMKDVVWERMIHV